MHGRGGELAAKVALSACLLHLPWSKRGVDDHDIESCDVNSEWPLLNFRDDIGFGPKWSRTKAEICETTDRFTVIGLQDFSDIYPLQLSLLPACLTHSIARQSLRLVQSRSSRQERAASTMKTARYGKSGVQRVATPSVLATASSSRPQGGLICRAGRLEIPGEHGLE